MRRTLGTAQIIPERSALKPYRSFQLEYLCNRQNGLPTRGGIFLLTYTYAVADLRLQ